MIIPEIEQEPLIMKNVYVNYRPGVTEIKFLIDYADQFCFEGWDAETKNQLYIDTMKDIIKLNHNYKKYKKNKKVIFPFHQKSYCGYLVKEGEKISECIDEDFGIMFRVPTELIIDYKQFTAEPEMTFHDPGHYDARGDKFFKDHERDKRKGRIINYYKENGQMIYIVLTYKSGYFRKLTKKDIISMSTYHKINPYYKYGEETDNVKRYE